MLPVTGTPLADGFGETVPLLLARGVGETAGDGVGLGPPPTVTVKFDVITSGGPPPPLCVAVIVAV